MVALNLAYRPSGLGSMIGNEDAVALVRAKFVDGPIEDRPHTVLITGPGGCGKTTMMRIIGRIVEALLPGETEENSRNYKELDNTADSGKEYVKGIKQGMKYKPTGKAKARVYGMDEVHGLSAAAKEALLKPTEKPPSHVYFVLATSEPEKLKVTIHRRALLIEMKPFEDEDTATLLKMVSKKKKVKIPSSVVDAIHSSSQGSPGMALKILERIIHLSPKKMKLHVKEEARKANSAYALADGLIKKLPWKKIIPILTDLKSSSPEGIRKYICTFCVNKLLKKDEPLAYSIMDAFRDPFFNDPYNQLVLAAYECLYADEE